MNILDENIITDERLVLRSWRVPLRHVGHDIGRRGIQDEEIIPFLLQLSRPTFFTRDMDFYDRRLCHARYCLAYLAIKKQEVAIFVRRFLRHKQFNTQAKRMGVVVQVSHTGLSVWRLHAEEEIVFSWSE